MLEFLNDIRTAYIAFAIFGFIMWLSWSNALGGGYQRTPIHKALRALALADVNEHSLVLELGCGTGKLALAIHKHFNCCVAGVEIDPLRYLIAKLRTRNRSDILILRGNVVNTEISGDFTHIFAFLNPRTLEKLSKNITIPLISYKNKIPNTQYNIWDPESSCYIYYLPQIK